MFYIGTPLSIYLTPPSKIYPKALKRNINRYRAIEKRVASIYINGAVYTVLNA